MSKSVIRSIKNVANGYTHAQVLVRNATANDSDGPTISQMEEITHHTYNVIEFKDIMDMIDKRLNDKGKYWKHVAKSLTLLDYLVRYGSEDVVMWSKTNLYIIKTLREFRYLDESGYDQGGVIRAKAKELTSLLRDDERLQMERRARGTDRRKERRRPNPRPIDDGNEYDDDLQRALEESKNQAALEEQRRKAMSGEDDDALQKALQLSKEEEELKRIREQEQQNLLDLDDEPQAQTSTNYQIGYIPQTQYVQFDVFGNPMNYGQQNPMATGFLQNAYGQFDQNAYLQQQQQLAQQQQLQQQQLAQEQAYQQQLLQQQQQQQQLQPLTTGSNNPFAMNNKPQQPDNSEELERLRQQQLAEQQRQQELFAQQQAQLQQQAALQQQQQQAQAEQEKPLTQTLTGQQRLNEKHSQLNNLLAEGTGIDTFGNTGDTRIPAQHTQTKEFINSQGTGFRTQTNSNPFFSSQYTGVPSAVNMTSTPTGYGFGNGTQTQAHQHNGNSNGNANTGSLIDL